MLGTFVDWAAGFVGAFWATLLIGGTCARLTTAPKPVITPQASSAARSIGNSLGTTTH